MHRPPSTASGRARVHEDIDQVATSVALALTRFVQVGPTTQTVIAAAPRTVPHRQHCGASDAPQLALPPHRPGYMAAGAFLDDQVLVSSPRAVCTVPNVESRGAPRPPSRLQLHATSVVRR